MKNETLKKSKKFCDKKDWRIGQLIWNVIADRTGENPLWETPEGNALFYISDKDLEQRLLNCINKQRKI